MTFRNIPSVEKVLSTEPVQKLLQDYKHAWIANLVRSRINSAREHIRNGNCSIGLDQIVEGVCQHVNSLAEVRPKGVINATGVIIHTNLGRSPLSSAAVTAMTRSAQGYSDLEFNLQTGERGSRQGHLQPILTQLTGAEGSLAVNNNAAAVLLGLAAVAGSGEVIISRGEAVEIGGGFRIPDVLLQSGARLVEVGATNRCYVSDYEKAISDKTSAILKVHASNFKVVGFTHTSEIKDLSQLASRRGIPLLHDIGSGCLLDTREFGLSYEPRPQDSILDGADLVFFSGDKLLGGPQSGIVIGQHSWVNKLARHPLARAFRIDKTNLAALMATLLHYLRDDVTERVPVWRMISATSDGVRRRAEILQERLGISSAVVSSKSTIGGGSLPGETLDTSVIAIPTAHPQILVQQLRNQDYPVVSRIEGDRVLLDIRTVLEEEDELLIHSVQGAIG
ncbi:L-seryl-tRNA(Sec) selenium transferase [SAR202 cluster bacterium AD-804-J14_MRT_500m]|nr:L-seryl-tRNA(Sec) selenium transferase [SAR202 cluster bacterium AD-804-J14_MRT_500m]